LAVNVGRRAPPPAIGPAPKAPTTTPTMPHQPLKPSRLPSACAALGVALVGLVNIASALTPSIRWRGRLLLGVEPVEAMRAFHALALPAGLALVLVAPYLFRRRRRAWRTAVALMVALGALDLLKGLDFEETAVTWGLAALLIAGRRGFTVRHDPLTLRSAVWRVPVLGALGLLGVFAATLAEAHSSPGGALRETWDLLRFQAGPIHFERHTALRHHFAWIPLAAHVVEVSTLAAIAYAIFRPLAAPRTLPSPGARRLAAEIVRAHGSDTLSFFKLRGDTHYLFSDDRRAFVGYRIENGVLLLSGDPVGPEDALRPLLAQLRAFAEVRGLRIGGVGASERLRPLYEEIGCKTIYLGDEAIVELARFSLEGRPIRKVRQSVTRLRKAGYHAECQPVTALDRRTLREAELVLEQGRLGAPERGFSMAMDSLSSRLDERALVVLARDGGGAIRGVLHFVPCYGRAAVSLSFMRRAPNTPNGLMEFLVASAAEFLRERGIEELSLNFAAFARWMHSPERFHERALGRLVTVANPFFQIESLYRFNAKFFPRWEPRYLVYEGAFGLPRVGLAAMWAEGQLPKPSLRRWGLRSGRRRGLLPIRV
jgi:lysyl-tRNA synthetase class 2